MRGLSRTSRDVPPFALLDGTHTVRGKAWSGTGPITQVDVSLTGEGEWHAARTRIDQFIRPDLNLYSGFSGGALLSPAGGVLGMNTSGLLRGKPLTLPSSTVVRIAEEIASKGHVARPYIGVVMQSVQIPESLQKNAKLASESGLLVMYVESGGPADVAGVLLGDLILAADGNSFDDLDDLQKVLLRKGVGQAVQASMIRGGQKLDLSIRIGERPSR